MTALLSAAYFAPVQWYQKLFRFNNILIERHDSFIKQTYRNRCLIATANGTQALTVPVTPETMVSSHGNWQHVHWNALQSAYGESPFFEYYADDLRPFFTERHDHLYDFDMQICQTVCQLLDIEPRITLTDHYITRDEAQAKGYADFREAIRPKHPMADPDFRPRRYYQVYEQRNGFLPNMSILDLLFNMGNESVLYL